MKATDAQSGIIALKDHYREAIDALSRRIENADDISLYIMRSYYPAGDEQQIVYQTVGRVVPTGGIPLDVGVVISNVSTLAGIAAAQRGIPVTTKYVTVGGAVRSPVTVNVPVGISMDQLIERAGGTTEDCRFIVGGPCMGRICTDLRESVTKTTGGLLAIPGDHPIFAMKGPEMNMQVIKAVCCQCTMCSQLCPRNALGLKVEPHKAMRSLVQGVDLIGDVNGIFSCCDCGLCTYYACNFGLKPSIVMSELKRKLSDAGIRPHKSIGGAVDAMISGKRLPTYRLMARMGLSIYDVSADIDEALMKTSRVSIPMKMHAGVPSVPVVALRDHVKKGDLIAAVPENALGANIHASIDGVITEVSDSVIVISQSGDDEGRN
jgi:Na+-translocating ferredoxin:NAD+ oxidoreductase RnfC subunit